MIRRVQEHNRLLPEADPDNADSVNGQQITIAIDKDGRTSVDGKSMQPDELRNKVRTMSDESSGNLSVVVQVDEQCRFEHVARILSLCEEAGIESPRLEPSRD